MDSEKIEDPFRELRAEAVGHSEDQFVNTPALIRDTFAKCKFFVTGEERDFYSIVRSKSPKLNQIWDVIAMWCNQANVNGRAYVEWCFASEYPAYPMPSKFITKYKKDVYLNSGCPDPQFNQVKLKFELMVHKMGKILPNQDVVDYLLDDRNTFDPVFIYTVAKNLGKQDELPAAILQRARQQVFCQPVYEERFKDVLPEELTAPWT
jgi:hypothetical protein